MVIALKLRKISTNFRENLEHKSVPNLPKSYEKVNFRSILLRAYEENMKRSSEIELQSHIKLPLRVIAFRNT